MHFSSQHHDMIMRRIDMYDLYCSFRLKCHWLCNHAYFGNLVLLCILLSSCEETKDCTGCHSG